MADEKKVSIRPKSLFPFKLPKIIFSPSSSTQNAHIISPPTGFQRNASIGINKETGNLDLNSVPHEFRELVMNLYENISKQKVIQTDEVVKDEVVQRRKGPTVQKGLKEEEILAEMKCLVTVGNPWDSYTMVRALILWSVFRLGF